MTKPPRRYAEGTSVTAEKSRAELEALLAKHGASEFALRTRAEFAEVAYHIHGRAVRHRVERPALKVRSYATQREKEAAANASEAEWRRRWRALLLLVKAKLELIASGQSTFEREFLADILLPNNQTVHEALLPKLEAAYRDGGPLLLLGAGDE